MFIADKWQDYTLIDADNGERLESWGGKILIRPDPQIIWNSGRKNPLWNKSDAVYKRSKEGGGNWVKKNIPDEWNISYGDLTFTISPMGFKHTGLFPEQAANWDWFVPLIKNSGREIKLLNLFAYTGGATVAAAKAGALVCHVDASKGMVTKAKQNAVLSKVPDSRIRYIVDDCIKFVEREIRRGSFYDAIILDPPSFGRGPNGERWVIEESLDNLISVISGVLSNNPLFVLLNSYTTGLSASTNGYILHNNIVRRFGGSVVSDELGIPVKESGIALPCGAASRWTVSK
ncbi:MAG: SAM-dependent methyltransferase [Clostridiales bacterium GWF2_36_10]|nr:MAG: SAM-dependent methyltransferase [Clostridiales bacterium GWF2_36_10]HAN21453.1 SAM-dependent methyltransferase [Clostridiales bacterium]